MAKTGATTDEHPWVWNGHVMTAFCSVCRQQQPINKKNRFIEHGEPGDTCNGHGMTPQSTLLHCLSVRVQAMQVYIEGGELEDALAASRLMGVEIAEAINNRG